MCSLPVPALCHIEEVGLACVSHCVKAINMVPTVGCKNLISSSTELDTGQESSPALRQEVKHESCKESMHCCLALPVDLLLHVRLLSECYICTKQLPSITI